MGRTYDGSSTMLQPIHVLRLSVAVLAVAVGVLWVRSSGHDANVNRTASRWPRLGIPMNDRVADLSNVTIDLRRSACFGRCPAYRVTIHGDGTGTYQGFAYVKRLGVTSFQVAPGAMVNLLDKLEAVDFMRFSHVCACGVKPKSFPVLSVSIGDWTHSIGNVAPPGELRFVVREFPGEPETHRMMDSLFTAVDSACGVEGLLDIEPNIVPMAPW